MGRLSSTARHHLAAAIGALAVAVSIALAIVLHVGALDALDDALLAGFAALRTPGRTIVALDITALGSTAVLTIVTVAVGLVLALQRRRRPLLHLVVASVGCAICSRAFKALVERDRPPLAGRLAEVTGWSYPSGHSLASAAIYLTLGLMLAAIAPRRIGRAGLAMAATIAVLVALSRCYLGVHYPSDIVAGLSFGTGWALLVAAVLHDWTPSAKPGH